MNAMPQKKVTSAETKVSKKRKKASFSKKSSKSSSTKKESTKSLKIPID
jgi:hypothetical protein